MFRTAMQDESAYEVIIVGGRAAGASLAARLGAHGVRTLVVDRARFPSLPQVPSCGILYPSALRLLDELGVDEDDFCDESSRVRRLVIDFEGHFDTCIEMPEVFGRDYAIGIDRLRFDLALWRNLDRFPSVTRREGAVLKDLLYDGAGSVIGVEVGTDGRTERIHARCVVGADGRFSTVARRVKAEVREDRSEHTSTVHYAMWEGVAPVDDDPRPAFEVHTRGRGSDVLFFPTAQRRTMIGTAIRSDRADIDGDVEGFYMRHVLAFAGVRQRLAGAQRISRVFGLKRIANRYLQAGGPGWVLLGDALHHKDPIDGQGIHDALAESRLLAEALIRWQDEDVDWDTMLADYDRAVMDHTHDMFIATTKRIQRELYGNPPTIIIKTILRWLLRDAEYARRFMMFLSRATPAKDWLPSSVVRRIMMRGLLGDLRGVFGRARP